MNTKKTILLLQGNAKERKYPKVSSEDEALLCWVVLGEGEGGEDE